VEIQFHWQLQINQLIIRNNHVAKSGRFASPNAEKDFAEKKNRLKKNSRQMFLNFPNQST